jgi:hypothetical protein
LRRCHRPAIYEQGLVPSRKACSHSVLTQRHPLAMPRSVQKASAFRGSTCIDGAARKNDHRKMLRELDIPRHMDHHAHLHTAQSQRLEWRARPDAYCVNAWLRSSTCTASAIRALICHATPSRHGAASESRAGQRVPTLPHMQPLRALSQEQRSDLSEG